MQEKEAFWTGCLGKILLVPRSGSGQRVRSGALRVAEFTVSGAKSQWRLRAGCFEPIPNSQIIRAAIDDGSGAFAMPAVSCAADSVFEIAQCRAEFIHEGAIDERIFIHISSSRLPGGV